MAGTPATEGNAVETVDALLRAYAGDIYWPDAPPERFLRAAGLPASPRIRRGPGLHSHRSLLEYLRSEIVFTTHGVYGMPPSSERRPVIDVWHGEYAKSGGPLYPGRLMRSYPSTVMTSASKLLAPLKMEMAGMPQTRCIWVGNPRVRQLSSPATDEDLETLGLDPTRPFIVWLPTWRRGRGVVAGAVNTRDVSADKSLAGRFARDVGSVLARAGVNVVVKPHPLDAESRVTPDATVLTQAILDDAAVPLYRLLGRADGLVSDYSSVWIDYLAIDKPTAFFMPDRSAFDRGTEDSLTEAYDCLPGQVLDAPATVAAFADEVLGDDTTAPLRANARRHLKLWVGDEPGITMLEELERRDLIRLG